MWLLSTAKRHLAFGLALAGGLFAGLANAADPVTPPGSRISLAPPKGFVVATTFTGFQDQAHHASILMAEFPPVAFTQFRNGLTAEAMAKRGMRLLSTETIEGLPYEQITVRAEQRAGNQVFDKWLMVINGPDMTGMLTVSIAKPAPKQLSDAVIRTALASVRIHATASGDPIAALPFSIEPAARFAYRKPLAGRGLLLKETPPPPEGKLDDVGFIVSLATEATIAPSDQQRFGEQQFLSSRTITDQKILSTRPLTTSNMAGFEYLGEGKGAGGRPLRYLVVALYPWGRPFVLLGMAPPERFDEALPEFRAMVESFKAKP
ncbi:hypothetical protein JQ609_08715 [Bradyrhizobium sp. AUGA SZCCT0169]|uniref:hypothetical protein n=1 Tax=Bradyrhizobium sp. AUGA SZCCT0169 TaxID=2807663 RepID=UPI001BA62104|nr:hypothetical protein [Bradyrhizobium sp. AUGA SZCCT0169]MBR1247012.1 hypothetical protein [Bradyrhizobium sp. AUGA SZCCT0169]